MLLSGRDDTIGPTSIYADQIMAALPHTGATHVHLNYPNAGHVALDIPYAPSTSADGGSPAANEAAHEHDWPARSGQFGNPFCRVP